MGALKGVGGANLITSVPRDLHLEQQLRPEWVDKRAPRHGLPSCLKGLFNRTCAGVK